MFKHGSDSSQNFKQGVRRQASILAICLPIFLITSPTLARAQQASGNKTTTAVSAAIRGNGAIEQLFDEGSQRLTAGNYAGAENAFREAIHLLEQYPSDSSKQLLENRAALALALFSQGKHAEAAAEYERALPLARAILGDMSVVAHDVRLAIYRSLQSVDDADARRVALYKDIANGALQLRKVDLESSSIILEYASGLPVDEAEFYFLETFEALWNSADRNSRQSYQALRSYTQVLIEGAKYSDVISLLRARLPEIADSEFQKPAVMNDLAAALVAAGDNDAARIIYSELIKLNDATQSTSARALVRDQYASFLMFQRDLREAEKLYNQAVELERSEGTRLVGGDRYWLGLIRRLTTTRLSSPSRAPSALADAEPLIEGYAYNSEASVWTTEAAAIDRENADGFLLYADAAWSREHNRAGGGARSLTPRRPQHEAVFLTLQKAAFDPATRAVNRSAALRAATRAGVGDLVAERETMLAALRTGNRSAVDGALVSSGDRLTSVESQIRSRAPDYYELLQPSPLSSAQAAKLMRSDEAALMLVPTKFGTHLVLVTSEGLHWFRSDLTMEQIGKDVRRLLWDLGADVGASATEAKEWTPDICAISYDFVTAKRLYDALIAPMEGLLSSKKSLFFVSSGALSSLPLGVLVSSIPEGSSGDPAVLRSAPWLADRFMISVIPSLQSLEFLRTFRSNSESSAQRRYLGVGDPLLSGTPQLSECAQARGAATGYHKVSTQGQARGSYTTVNPTTLNLLSRLPGTRREIESQWRRFGSPPDSVLLGADATETKVRADPKANILSFATHGLLAGELLGLTEPGLVLTPPAIPSELDDGYLSASEIATLTLNADLVLLSACNTAGGDGTEGAPGLSGIARSFYYAGARTLLVSHWPIGDDVSASLTVRALQTAAEHPEWSFSESFRFAAKETRNNASKDASGLTWAHPSAWAAFSVVGDGSRKLGTVAQ